MVCTEPVGLDASSVAWAVSGIANLLAWDSIEVEPARDGETTSWVEFCTGLLPVLKPSARRAMLVVAVASIAWTVGGVTGLAGVTGAVAI